MSVKKLRSFSCPDCDGHFSIWLSVEEGPPDHCPLCQSFMGEPLDLRGRTSVLSDEARNAPVSSPLISKPQNQTLDKVFRQMEAGSIARAEMAASQLGVPTSEMNHLKMTDMKDSFREGDVAAVVPKALDSRMTPIATTAEQGQYFEKAAQQGAGAGHHGMNMISKLKQSHATTAKRVQAAGRTN